MGGAERYLAEEEKLVLQVRRHPIVLLRPATHLALAVALGSLVGFVTGPSRGSDPIDAIAGLVAAFFLVRFLWRALQWLLDRVVVTNHRIFEVSGIVTRNVASMPLTKVTDMTYRRSLLGRVLGYGELILESAGQSQALSRISCLPRPDLFYRTVTTLAEAKSAQPRRVPALDEMLDQPDSADTGPLPRVIV